MQVGDRVRVIHDYLCSDSVGRDGVIYDIANRGDGGVEEHNLADGKVIHLTIFVRMGPYLDLAFAPEELEVII